MQEKIFFLQLLTHESYTLFNWKVYYIEFEYNLIMKCFGTKVLKLIAYIFAEVSTVTYIDIRKKSPQKKSLGKSLQINIRFKFSLLSYSHAI